MPEAIEPDRLTVAAAVVSLRDIEDSLWRSSRRLADIEAAIRRLHEDRASIPLGGTRRQQSK